MPSESPMIVFVHLLNDRSGSPRVLRSVMAALADRDPVQLLYLGRGGDGFLGEAVPQARRYAYRRGSNPLATLWAYMVSQVHLSYRLWRARDIDRDAVLYVNTLLPFAAAVYGWLSGRRVVCHLHEASMRPWLLRWFLLNIARRAADCVICVSEFHRRSLGLEDGRVVFNAVDAALFTCGLRSVYVPRRAGVFNVCMLCSLRDYKGVPEFVRLAQELAADASLCFQLVVSDEETAARKYFDAQVMPDNLRVLHGVADVSHIYSQAGLVVNLSRVDLCQETFGLTLLEAMTFGVPVIAPPMGGPAELVENGVQGFLIDSRDADALRATVARLAGDEALCLRLSAQGRRKAQAFSPEVFQSAIRGAVFGE